MLKIYDFFIQPQKAINLIGILLCFSLNLEAQQAEGVDKRVDGYHTVITSQGRKLVRNNNETAKKTIEPLEKEPRYKYPLLNGLMIGIDIFEPVAMALGQTYGGYEASAELNLRNRFFPIWEIGIGRAKNTPEDLNFTYISKAALYNRIGLNYNFKYNSLSPNFFTVGARYGFTSFKYEITDIQINSPYWDNSFTENILDQRSSAQWIELLGGIRVKVFKDFYMGWSFRYKFILTSKKSKNSSPWYIPGYGVENIPIGLTYSIYYRIPFHKEKKQGDITPEK